MKFYNKCSENSRSQIVVRTDIFRKLSGKEMSRVLPPTAFKPILKQPTDLLQDRSDVGCKTLLTTGPSTALLVNLFYSNVARRVECFLLPVLASDPVRVKTDC